MSINPDNRPAQTLNEQSSNQEPLKLLQETQLCGATLSVYSTPIEPLFKAKEVAEILEHSNHKMMLEGVDEDEKGVRIAYSPGGNQSMWFLTEQGLYEVLMQSRKPIAKDFKRGVKKLLKGIRTGEYHLSNTFIDTPTASCSLPKTVSRASARRSRRATKSFSTSKKGLI